MSKDVPNFGAWQIDTLAKYALEQYLQNIQLREALEQARLDLKDAMAANRKLLKERDIDDWK